MTGNIYTNQKCTKCGGTLKHDDKRKGCFCPEHKTVSANRFFVRFPGGIFQRFTNYDEASRYLNYLRFEKDNRQTRFNPDDYRSARPNSFAALAPKYLERKKDHATHKKICSYINRAAEVLGPMNVREITGADIEDYLFSIPSISEKTRFNHMTQLRDFWTWCLKRGNIITLSEMPTFPEINFELGRRKITNWTTQAQIIAKIKEISYEINPKIYLGVDMLAAYTALRPDDLRRVTESSLDANGWMVIHNPTKRKNKFKTIQLFKEHVALWREIQRQYPAMPDVPFFRHVGGIPGCAPGEIFGPKYFNTWWTRACAELGVEGVPLYPGTKHTTANETAKLLGTDAARTASGLTNKAFDRYCDVQNTGAFDIATAARKAQQKKAEVLPFRRAIKRQ